MQELDAPFLLSDISRHESMKIRNCVVVCTSNIMVGSTEYK